MGNFLHKLFGYSDEESSCFRPKSNQIQPEFKQPHNPQSNQHSQQQSQVQQKPKQQPDIERGLNPSPAKTSSTAASSYRSANTNFDGYSSDEDDKHSTMFPKVSVKRSLQNSSPLTVMKSSDDYNNNNNNYNDNNNLSHIIPIPGLPNSDRNSPVKDNNHANNIVVVDDSSFQSIELNTQSMSSQNAQNDDTSFGMASKSSNSVHITHEPESLPNIDLNQEFVSPFTRGFTLPQHSVLEVPEKFRPRRSNIRMSTRIMPSRNASDSRKNGTRPFVQKDPSRKQSQDSDDETNINEDKEENPKPEVNLEELPTEELRKVTKSRLSDMLKRQSQLINGELAANRYRSVYEFTDNYGRYKVVDGNSENQQILEENTDKQRSENSHNQLENEHDNVTVLPAKSDKIQELLNSNHNQSDDDDCYDEMEPIPEHNDSVTLRKPANITAPGHLQLMEELKKRQSARIVFEG